MLSGSAISKKIINNNFLSSMLTQDEKLTPTYLSSSVPQMTRFLQGGLPFGYMSEWGLAWGSELRQVLLSFISTTTSSQWCQPLWTLWIHTCSDTKIYPPAWEARGIDLSFIRFAMSCKPLIDLKAVFLDPFFKIIVLDLNGHRPLKPEDYTFLAKAAKSQNQVLIVIRNELLCSQRGNVWAKLRINGWKNTHNQIELQILKGLPPKKMILGLDSKKKVGIL